MVLYLLCDYLGPFCELCLVAGRFNEYSELFLARISGRNFLLS